MSNGWHEEYAERLHALECELDKIRSVLYLIVGIGIGTGTLQLIELLP